MRDDLEVQDVEDNSQMRILPKKPEEPKFNEGGYKKKKKKYLDKYRKLLNNDYDF